MERERHKRMLTLLAERGGATIMQLVDWLGVSEATVRRDVRQLVASQQVQSGCGTSQVLLARGARQSSSSTFHASLRMHADRKRAIARRAMQLCAPGDTILVGGGTTTCYLADFMAGRRLRIMTNSFELACRTLAASDNEVILFGGKIYRDQGVVLSPFDAHDLRDCYADHLFMGMHCVSPLGMMETDPLLIQAGQRLMPQAQQITVLADSSKLVSRGGMLLCGLDKITRLITDNHAPAGAVQMLERAGVEVLLVTPASASATVAVHQQTIN